MLVNLLSNALRHTPVNGTIVVETGVENGRVRLTISDTGPGISPEDAANVFERFYRVDKGRPREGDRSNRGLELAVARSIIEAHDGHIGVDSEPEQGATFWFTLPVDRYPSPG